jgi:hypothetical protein
VIQNAKIPYVLEVRRPLSYQAQMGLCVVEGQGFRVHSEVGFGGRSNVQHR